MGTRLIRRVTIDEEAAREESKFVIVRQRRVAAVTNSPSLFLQRGAQLQPALPLRVSRALAKHASRRNKKVSADRARTKRSTANTIPNFRANHKFVDLITKFYTAFNLSKSKEQLKQSGASVAPRLTATPRVGSDENFSPS